MTIGLEHPAQIAESFAVLLQYRQVNHLFQAYTKSELRDFTFLAVTLANITMGVVGPTYDPRQHETATKKKHTRPRGSLGSIKIAERS